MFTEQVGSKIYDLQPEPQCSGTVLHSQLHGFAMHFQNMQKSYHPLVRFKRKLRLSTFKSIDNTVVNTSLLYYKLIRQRFLRLTKKVSLAIKVK